LSSLLSVIVESFTKTRLKYAEVKTKSTNITTNSTDKEQIIKKKNKEKKQELKPQTSIASTSNIPLNVASIYNDKTFEDEVIKIIESLNDKEYIFPASLNARERRIVHELSEKYKINHLSVGENEERRIKISKVSFKVTNEVKCEKNIVIESETDEDDEKVIENRFSKLNVENIESKKITLKSFDEEPKKKIETKRCPHCLKDIQIQNFTMHELQCQRIKSASLSESANKSKVKKNKLENANADDFDELISISNELNSICNYIGCKIKVQTLGQNCSYCRRRFCFTHSLAEIHG
jgi:ATP-dependent RNA/DNA helicase IGHMBP2